MPTNKSQSSIYESYSMLNPEGALMCYCKEKKAQWYIERHLAQWWPNAESKQFKLTFMPEGNGKSHSPYYTQSMENRCVVCGSTEDLNKHHVVPYVFRSRFPLQYKESNHHDILATCIDCHEAYEGFANEFKDSLAQHSGVSINDVMSPEQKNNRKIASARNLLKKIDNQEFTDMKGKAIIIPEEKIKSMRELAAKELSNYVSHPGAVWADKIIQDVFEENRLEEFIQSWRQHFLDFAKPRYLPNHWSVQHPLESTGKNKESV